jgi:glutamine amidotransferase-like uncharacterized protein
MKTLIYQDYVHNNGSIFKALSKNPHIKGLEYADAADILNGILNKDIQALVMPGGASRYVSAKLNGAGNRAILDYVSAGGTYIGICAGAYYGARAIEWKRGTQDEILVENELSFYLGAAIGPAKAFKPADIVKLEVEDKTVSAFYRGGPVFEETVSGQVLARYADLPDKPPAIVSGQYGEGKFLLISPHLEFDTAQLDLLRFDVADNRHAEIAAMKFTAGLTTDFFHELMDQFLA